MFKFLSDQDLNYLKAILVDVYRLKESRINSLSQVMEIVQDYYDNLKLLNSIQLCSLDEGLYCWEFSKSKDANANLAIGLQKENASHSLSIDPNHELPPESIEWLHPDIDQSCHWHTSQYDDPDDEYDDERDRQRKFEALFYENIRPLSKGYFKCIAASNKPERFYILFDTNHDIEPHEAILETEATIFRNKAQSNEEHLILKLLDELMVYGKQLQVKKRQHSGELAIDYATQLTLEFNKYCVLKYHRSPDVTKTYHEDIASQVGKFNATLDLAYNVFSKDHQPGFLHALFINLCQTVIKVLGIPFDSNQELTLGNNRPGFFNKTTRQKKIIEVNNIWSRGTSYKL